MRIAYISPFPPTRHGIGTYTNYLYQALSAIHPETNFLIVADKRTRERTTRSLSIVPCFDLAETVREDEIPGYVGSIVQAVSEFAPEIVHVQHGFSIFYPDESSLSLLERLRAQAKLIVTLHAVFTDETSHWPDMTMSMEEYNRRVSRLADAVIVHQESMKEALVRQGVDDRSIRVIPHGTQILRQVDKRGARRTLGLPENCRIVLSFGFFGDQKNKELLIDALPYVRQRVPDCHLFLSGCVREWIREDLEKREGYQSQSRRLGVQDHVIFASEFLSDDSIHLAFAAADVAAFPYFQKYLSASGSLHLAMGAFKPIVVSKVPKFEEAWTKISSEIAFDPNCPSELASTLVRLLVDSNFRESVVTRVKSYALRTSWNVIAQDHLRLYNSLLADRRVLARA